MATVLRGPGSTDENLVALHDFLTARGWVIDDWGQPGGRYPANGQPAPFVDDGWCYPASYGGVTMASVDDVTPYPLRCRFDWEYSGPDSDPLTLEVISAGMYEGCTDHNEQEHLFEFDQDDELDLEHLGAILDDLETRARELDPKALIECRFFGACAEGHK